MKLLKYILAAATVQCVAGTELNNDGRASYLRQQEIRIETVNSHPKSIEIAPTGNTGQHHEERMLAVHLEDEEELAATQTLLRDYDFTRTLRDAINVPSKSRHLSGDDDTCLASGSQCNDHTANCCRGGCNSSKKCFCQATNRLCFNVGQPDRFCCSNKCGTNGRCECISEGESCTVGDGGCCNGYICGVNGKCAKEGQLTQGFFPLDPVPQPVPVVVTKHPTRHPTRYPTPFPTKKPITNPTVDLGQSSSNNPNCKPKNRVCFYPNKPDPYCCSNHCGINGRCNDPPATPNPTNKPTPHPTLNTLQGAGSKSATDYVSLPCVDPSHIKLTVEIQTDKYGGDTGWFLKRQDSPDAHKFVNVPNGTYGLYAYDRYDHCVPPGVYNFTVTDRYGDGICCAYGEGYVKAHIDGREVLHVIFQGKVLSELLNVGYDPNPVMTERDYLYLDAHNRRREEWYADAGLSNVPMQWSPMIAEESRIWANTLLVNCSGAGIEHEPGVAEGENLAKNTGTVNATGLGWGQLYPPDKIVGRWVEWEIERDYPGNAHLTQALWRPAKYMGCGESMKMFRNGYCRVQVCRYARAGNCNMAKYNSTEGRNWLPPMLADTSRCGPNCPPEGCF